jgi:hydroxyacylglutathione hydrolase
MLFIRRLAAALAVGFIVAGAARAEPPRIEHLPLSAPWRAGAPDCAKSPQPPLEVRAYGEATFVLRENPCATFEAPFMYLLVGKTAALLIDTGDVADAGKAPLADTVLRLLPQADGRTLPLLVVHSHRHMDHRAGDGQFGGRPDVRVVGYDLASVQRFYGFVHWPQGHARIDLGDRIVDVIPTPGHNATEVSFYDEATSLFFTGDFLLPGRLLIDDAAADRESAARAAAFVRDRPVAAVLGGHIEFDAAGRAIPWQSQWHPSERPLPMTKADVLALPAAVAQFNGLYTVAGGFEMVDSERLLEIAAGVAGFVLIAALAGVFTMARRRRRRRPRLFAVRT